jgi:osmotically-inducible protein OsmY
MTKGTTVKNDQLEADVKEELSSEPRVDSNEIAAYVSAGTVTLRGTVGSPRQQIEAKRAAKRVHGVKSVVDELEVRPLPGHEREDAEVRGAVLQAFALDSVVPQTIDAQVQDGKVTLSGTATWQFERDEAEFVTNNIPGVVRVQSEIELTGPPPEAGKVRDSIQEAMRRSAAIEAERIQIRTSDGTVTLSGTVDSWAQHDAVVSAAWRSPGVHHVVDEVDVTF